MSKTVEIWTDGGCRPTNPGPGGWAAVLRFGESRKEMSGTLAHTTNNRMEILAAIKALEALDERCDVLLYTDSTYLRDSMEKGWVVRWQKKNWKMDDHQERPNRDLWKRLLIQTAKHNVTFVKVKAHSDNADNNRCDEMVGEACRLAANTI